MFTFQVSAKCFTIREQLPCPPYLEQIPFLVACHTISIAFIITYNHFISLLVHCFSLPLSYIYASRRQEPLIIFLHSYISFVLIKSMMSEFIFVYIYINIYINFYLYLWFCLEWSHDRSNREEYSVLNMTCFLGNNSNFSSSTLMIPLIF